VVPERQAERERREAEQDDGPEREARERERSLRAEHAKRALDAAGTTGGPRAELALDTRNGAV
jgi:hypothetical protein